MKGKPLLAGVLLAGVALLPLLIWQYLKPLWPAQLPLHYTNGIADGFTSPRWLRDVAALPVVLYLVLTFVPQIHSTGFSFWRSQRQRQLRAVLVVAAACILAALLGRVAFVR